MILKKKKTTATGNADALDKQHLPGKCASCPRKGTCLPGDACPRSDRNVRVRKLAGAVLILAATSFCGADVFLSVREIMAHRDAATRAERDRDAFMRALRSPLESNAGAAERKGGA